MPDSQTDPLASGANTSEGKLSIAAVVSGLLIAVLGGVAPLFTNASAQNPNVLWLQLAAIVAGACLAAATTASFNKSRTLLKENLLDILREGGAVAAPAIAAALLKRYLKPPPSSTAPTPAETPSAKAAGGP